MHMVKTGLAAHRRLRPAGSPAFFWRESLPRAKNRLSGTFRRNGRLTGG